MSKRSLSLLPFVLLLASCGGGGGGGGTEPTHTLEVVKWTPSGDNQTDTVNQTLPNVIRVKVTLDGTVTAGVTVNFSGGILGTPSMVTGSNGIATSTWTLDPVAGPQSVTATVTGAVGSPLTFHATGIPGPATKVMLAGGDEQASDTSHIFPFAFSVQVVDTFGNGIAGRWVHWSATGPLTLATDSIITDASGFSNMFATAHDSGGAITVTATVPGLPGSPINFSGAVVPAPVLVNIQNFAFTPDSIYIAAGSAVKWTWVHSGHTLSPTGATTFTGTDIHDAGFVWGPILFSTPGVYTYECSVHPAQMQGKIVVH